MDLTSPFHLILIILVIALLFGGKKIPELMKGIGQGVKEFKKASSLDEEKEKPGEQVTDVRIPDKDPGKNS